MDSSAHGDVVRSRLDELEALDEVFLRFGAVRDQAGRIVDFRYDDCNRAALNLLGRRREDLIGRHLLELFPSHLTNGLFDAYVQVAETGQPTRREFAFDENGVVGEFEVLACRFGDGTILVGHEISARKTAERRLTTLAEQLQQALNTRVAIEQAKGYLAAQAGTDTDTAFAVIRRYARNHNQRIHDVARAIVNGELDLSPDS